MQPGLVGVISRHWLRNQDAGPIVTRRTSIDPPEVDLAAPDNSITRIAVREIAFLGIKGVFS